MSNPSRGGESALRRGPSAENLTSGSIVWGILNFSWPIFLGQLLQQFYNMADAWVVGNYADHNAFAAVSSGGSLTFLIVGLCNGIAMGGGVVISRYYGAKDEEKITRAIHANFLFGLLTSVFATVIGLLLVPHILVWMRTPAEVLPESLLYFRVYFAGVCTVILYNTGMAILRALGDSLHPLLYLLVSSAINVVLDLVFVAALGWGVAGAAFATVLAQGLSAALCLWRMFRLRDDVLRLDLHKLHWDRPLMAQVLRQGIPSGIQNSVISIANVVIQSNINSFGSFAMAGHGAYSRLEGFAFLPIASMSMSLPTFISQNLGARKTKRAKQGAAFGLLFGMGVAELVGVVMYFSADPLLGIFIRDAQSLAFGRIFMHTTPLFFCLLAFSNCAAGVLRGVGRSMVPMVTMLSIWCGFRIVYVTVALQFFPVFDTIAWAYPITWSMSTLVYVLFLLKMDWNKGRL